MNERKRNEPEILSSEPRANAKSRNRFAAKPFFQVITHHLQIEHRNNNSKNINSNRHRQCWARQSQLRDQIRRPTNFFFSGLDFRWIFRIPFALPVASEDENVVFSDRNVKHIWHTCHHLFEIILSLENEKRKQTIMNNTGWRNVSPNARATPRIAQTLFWFFNIELEHEQDVVVVVVFCFTGWLHRVSFAFVLQSHLKYIENQQKKNEHIEHIEHYQQLWCEPLRQATMACDLSSLEPPQRHPAIMKKFKNVSVF